MTSDTYPVFGFAHSFRFSSRRRRRLFRELWIASGLEARRLCRLVNAKPTFPLLSPSIRSALFISSQTYSVTSSYNLLSISERSYTTDSAIRSGKRCVPSNFSRSSLHILRMMSETSTFSVLPFDFPNLSLSRRERNIWKSSSFPLCGVAVISRKCLVLSPSIFPNLYR